MLKLHLHTSFVFYILYMICLLFVFAMQIEVLCVLKEASRLNPDLLQTQIKDVKHKHREDRSDCL